MHQAWERCPELCDADPSLACELGCVRPRGEPWVIAPGLELERCPMSVLQELSSWAVSVIDLEDDRSHHTCPDWPGAYTAGTVQAVRLLSRERAACTVEVMRRERPKPPA